MNIDNLGASVAVIARHHTQSGEITEGQVG